MTKPEWGRKIQCVSCGVRFYDLHRNPAPCPSCGAQNDPLQVFRPKRSAKAVAKAEAAPVKAAPETAAEDGEATENDDADEDLPELDDVADDDALLDSDDDDEDLMEDTDDLADDDDMSEVQEHMEPSDKET